MALAFLEKRLRRLRLQRRESQLRAWGGLRSNMRNGFAYGSLRNPHGCLQQAPYRHSLEGFPLEDFDLCSSWLRYKQHNPYITPIEPIIVASIFAELQYFRLRFLPDSADGSSHALVSGAVQKLTVVAGQVSCNIINVPLLWKRDLAKKKSEVGEIMMP